MVLNCDQTLFVPYLLLHGLQIALVDLVVTTPGRDKFIFHTITVIPEELVLCLEALAGAHRLLEACVQLLYCGEQLVVSAATGRRGRRRIHAGGNEMTSAGCETSGCDLSSCCYCSELVATVFGASSKFRESTVQILYVMVSKQHNTKAFWQSIGRCNHRMAPGRGGHRVSLQRFAKGKRSTHNYKQSEFDKRKLWWSWNDW